MNSISSSSAAPRTGEGVSASSGKSGNGELFSQLMSQGQQDQMQAAEGGAAAAAAGDARSTAAAKKDLGDEASESAAATSARKEGAGSDGADVELAESLASPAGNAQISSEQAASESQSGEPDSGAEAPAADGGMIGDAVASASAASNADATDQAEGEFFAGPLSLWPMVPAGLSDAMQAAAPRQTASATSTANLPATPAVSHLSTSGEAGAVADGLRGSPDLAVALDSMVTDSRVQATALVQDQAEPMPLKLGDLTGPALPMTSPAALLSAVDAGLASSGLEFNALDRASFTNPGGAVPRGAVTADQLTQHAVALIRQLGDQQAEARLQLHPAELGQLDFELRQDGQRLEVTVTVDNESSRRLVQDQLSQWRERLGESGMQLAQLDVNVRDHSDRRDSDMASGMESTDQEGGVKNPAPIQRLRLDSALDLYA